MVAAVMIVQIVVSALLIVVILIQGGENVDMAAAFGGSSQAAFGPRGAVTTLAKITWVLGAIFMAACVMLAIWASRRSSGSVLETAPAQTQSAPATPTPAKK